MQEDVQGNRSDTQSFLSTLFGAVLCAGAVVLGILGVLYFVDRVQHHLELNEQRAAWPTVQGKVVSSKAWVQHGDYSDWLNVTVKFAYDVDGRIYSAEQKWSGSCAGCGEKTVKKTERRYAPRTLMTVSYDPANPGDALIRPKGWPDGWLILAVLAGLVGLIAAIVALTLAASAMNTFSSPNW